jgi:hypothetical protein
MRASGAGTNKVDFTLNTGGRDPQLLMGRQFAHVSVPAESHGCTGARQGPHVAASRTRRLRRLHLRLPYIELRFYYINLITALSSIEDKPHIYYYSDVIGGLRKSTLMPNTF